MRWLLTVAVWMAACGGSGDPPAPVVPPAGLSAESEPPTVEPPAVDDLSDATRDGRSRVQAQDFDGAIAILDLALAEAPGDADALHWRGKAWEGKGDKAHAEQDYVAALVADSDHAEAAQSLADLMVAQRRCADAMPYLDARVEREPDDATVWVNRAFCRKQVKDYQGSHTDLVEACNLGNERACRADKVIQGRLSTLQATEAAKAVGLEADDPGGF